MTCDSLWSDFTNSGWVDDNDPSWGVCYPGRLHQIYTDSRFVYAAYSEGLDIIDIFSETKVAYIDYTYGFTSVCGDSEKIYLGTLDDGVKYIDKTTISGSVGSPYNLSVYLNTLNSGYTPSSNRVRSLFVVNNNLSIVTLEGIDVIGLEPGREYKSSAAVSGVTKSFLTSKNELYYINYLNVWRLNKVNSFKHDWNAPDVVYKVGEKFFVLNGVALTDIVIRDLFVTENTSSVDGFNTLFLATSSGTYVFDEGTREYGLYREDY